MLNELRGRNLAHVGCTVGLVAGLLAGMFAGIIIISVVHSASASNWAALTWIGFTFALGLLGFLVGGKISARLWGTSKTVDK